MVVVVGIGGVGGLAATEPGDEGGGRVQIGGEAPEPGLSTLAHGEHGGHGGGVRLPVAHADHEAGAVRLGADLGVNSIHKIQA